MLILKIESFVSDSDVAKFVNINNIPRENIVTITRSGDHLGKVDMVIYYYADSETKEKRPGFFG